MRKARFFEGCMLASILLSLSTMTRAQDSNVTGAATGATKEDVDVATEEPEEVYDDDLDEVNINGTMNMSSPTQAPTIPTFPPTGEGGCYTSLDAVYFLISDDDKLFQQKKFVICPGTVMDIGFLVPGVGIDQGQSPIVPRSNTEFLCGEDGAAENNCVVRGGDFGVIAVPVFFRQDLSVNNVVIKGFTFTEQVQYGAFVATAGDIDFINCIFKDSANFGPMVFNFDKTLDLGRRLEEDERESPWDRALSYIQMYHAGSLPKRNLAEAQEYEALSTGEIAAGRDLQGETYEAFIESCEYLNLQQVERKLGVEFGIISIKTPDHIMTFKDCTFANNQYGNQELTPIGYGMLIQGSDVTLDGVCFVDNDFRGNGIVLLEETADPFSPDADFLKANYVTTGDDDLDCDFAAYFATDDDRRNENFTCVPPQAAECGGEAVEVSRDGSAAESNSGNAAATSLVCSLWISFIMLVFFSLVP